jgi:transcription antitermination factor NusG
MSTLLNSYRTQSNQWRKAKQEMARADIRSHVPLEPKDFFIGPTRKRIVRKVPVAPGYIFAGAKPYDAVYVHKNVGPARSQDIAGLIRVGRVRPNAARVKKFAIGEAVKVKRGPLAELAAHIARDRGKGFWDVTVSLFGKPSTTKVHQSNILKAIDYG